MNTTVVAGGDEGSGNGTDPKSPALPRFDRRPDQGEAMIRARVVNLVFPAFPFGAFGRVCRETGTGNATPPVAGARGDSIASSRRLGDEEPFTPASEPGTG
ncbi:hypothetical protein [Streptosporangium longisporum]|uniref:hypothetical protein n=1 Tax=Streptosporangium longisporum TaxID=46187 RepID=UPI0039A57F38